MVSYTIILVYHYCISLLYTSISSSYLTRCPFTPPPVQIFAIFIGAFSSLAFAAKTHENQRELEILWECPKNAKRDMFLEKNKNRMKMFQQHSGFFIRTSWTAGVPVPIFKCLWLERLRQLVQAWNRCNYWGPPSKLPNENHGSWKIIHIFKTI